MVTSTLRRRFDNLGPLKPRQLGGGVHNDPQINASVWRRHTAVPLVNRDRSANEGRKKTLKYDGDSRTTSTMKMAVRDGIRAPQLIEMNPLDSVL